MTTVTCQKCRGDNPVGRGFCQFCGMRLAPLPSEPETTEHDEVDRLRDEVRAGERAMAALSKELERARQDLVAVKQELDSHKKAITDPPGPSEKRIAEEGRLRDSLAKSEQDLAAVRLEVEAAKAKLGSTEDELKAHLATGAQAVAALELELKTAREQAAAQLKEKQVGGDQAIALLKQEQAGAVAKAVASHKEEIVKKQGLIEELKAKLEGFVEREKKALPGQVTSVAPLESEAATSRRSFGMAAMTAAAALFTGAGGVGGYVFHGDSRDARKADDASVADLQVRLAEASKINGDLQEGLRSQHEAYERINADLKRADDQLSSQTVGNSGAAAGDDVQRQLADARAANQQLQQKVATGDAALAQSRQDLAARDHTIAQLQAQLQEVKSSQNNKSQENKPQDTKEVRPRPRRAPDFETTIRDLEREYNIPGIGR